MDHSLFWGLDELTYSTEVNRADHFSLRELLEQFAEIPETEIPNEIPKGSRFGNFENDRLRLLQRLHDLNKIKTMAAPEIFAEESFPDANIVAEYLENRLDDSDLAAEYEKICSESDMLLAELTSSFLLHKKLGKISVSVPRHCRHRLYYLACSDRKEAGSRESKSRQVGNFEDNAERSNRNDRTQTLFSPSQVEDIPDSDPNTIRVKSSIEKKKSVSAKKSHQGFHIMGFLFFLLILILFFYGEKNREGESISGDPERTVFPDSKGTPGSVPDFNDPDRFAVYVKSNPHLDQRFPEQRSREQGSQNPVSADPGRIARKMEVERSIDPQTEKQKSPPGKTDSIVSRELFIIPEINNAVFSR
ncbi:MAG: hypothetical protein Q4G69_08585 [Planctomycetia bacterium]|nr:hypothetical protein [Planctomycetia bacterium]